MAKEIAEHFLKQYIIYLRKSRSDGDLSIKEVLEKHERQLIELVRENNYYVPSENIYREVASSETFEDRPEITTILKRLESEDIEGIIVVDPQRLTRGNLKEIGNFTEILAVTQTKVVTPLMTYDCNKPQERKFLEQELIRGNDYLDYTKQILARGRYASAKAGLFIGSVAPFGYKKKKLKKGFTLEFNEETEIVRMMFQWNLDGIGTCKIANRLNELSIKSRKNKVWDLSMVRSILRNEIYMGKIVWKKRPEEKQYKDGKINKVRVSAKEYEIFEGKHDGIVTEEEWKQVYKNTSRDIIKNVPDKYELVNPLAGLIKCSYCCATLNKKKYRNKIVNQYKEIDKEKLLPVLREYKEKSGFSLTQIAKILDVSRTQVSGWFATNVDRFYTSDVFRTKWFELKDLLNIKTNEFDYLTEKVSIDKTQPPSLICETPTCKNVSSYLHIIEEGLLNELSKKLNEIQYYLDNYEEVTYKQKSTKKTELEIVTREIEKIETQIETIDELLELKQYTYEKYQKRMSKLEPELERLKAKKEELNHNEEEEKIVRYKKAVPILAYCLNDYHTLTIPDKNKLLKLIVNHAVYKKTNDTGRWNKNAQSDIELIVHLNI